MSTIRRSLAFAAADSYFTLVVQLASTVVLARILTPQEIGVFAIAAVFTALAGAFRNFGITEYLIQEKQLDDAMIRAALAVNITVSWFIGSLLFVLAPALASFFRQPVIADVIHLQALSFLFIPFGAITMAWFRRELNLKPVFIASLLANSVSFVVGIGLALKGYGSMSLAWAALAGVLVTVAVSLAYRPAGFPFWPSWKGTRKVFHFGKHASGIYLFTQLGNGAPEMVIGRLQDAVAVAFFSRANGLVELFNKVVVNATWPVVLPYFARAEREHDGIKRAYLTGVGYLSVVSWPILFCMGLLSYSAIRIFYGPQWAESVGLAQIMCAVAAVNVPYHLTKEALLAKGLVRQSNLLVFSIQGFRIAGLLAVVPYGLVGACWGLMGAALVGGWFSHRMLAQHIGLSASDTLAACLPSLRIALLAVLPVALLTWAVPAGPGNYVWLALLSGLLFVTAWAWCMHRVRHPLWLELLQVLGPRVRRVLRVGSEGH